MHPRTRYLALALALSVLLFGLWWFLVTSEPGQFWPLDDMGFAVPVGALLLGSSLPLGEKGRALGWLVGALVAGAIVLRVAGLETVIRDSADAAAIAVTMLYHVFRFGVPISVLLWVTRGGDLALLWTPPTPERTQGLRACPICGQKRAGLEAHVRDAHGEGALSRLRKQGRV